MSFAEGEEIIQLIVRIDEGQRVTLAHFHVIVAVKLKGILPPFRIRRETVLAFQFFRHGLRGPVSAQEAPLGFHFDHGGAVADGHDIAAAGFFHGHERFQPAAVFLDQLRVFEMFSHGARGGEFFKDLRWHQARGTGNGHFKDAVPLQAGADDAGRPGMVRVAVVQVPAVILNTRNSFHEIFHTVGHAHIQHFVPGLPQTLPVQTELAADRCVHALGNNQLIAGEGELFPFLPEGKLHPVPLVLPNQDQGSHHELDALRGAGVKEALQ